MGAGRVGDRSSRTDFGIDRVGRWILDDLNGSYNAVLAFGAVRYLGSQLGQDTLKSRDELR